MLRFIDRLRSHLRRHSEIAPLLLPGYRATAEGHSGTICTDCGSGWRPDDTSIDARAGLPLCIDLDGTLLRVNALHEAAIAAVLTDWRIPLLLPAWVTAGRARLKQELASRWRFAAAQLPYSGTILRLIEQQRALGRPIVLCTAADRRVAHAIADHLGAFDEVLASDGTENLRGRRKADALCRRFGERGFIYAGNDATDHLVWQRAAGAVLVNAPKSVFRSAVKRYRVLAVIDDRSPRLQTMLRALRPFQWVKNLFALVPVLASGDFTNPVAWQGSLAITAGFCATASAVYVINDLADLAADRAHPRKRCRPFASGALPLATGLVMVPVLFAVGAVLGIASGAGMVLALYAMLSLAYTARLKEQPLVDVFILATLYSIRLFGGGEASGHPVSIWLLGFSSFLFLSLALVKRVAELHQLQLASQRRSERRGYTTEDVVMLQMFGAASAFASAIVLSLYVQSDTALHSYVRPGMLWAVVPLLLFWQCRLWLSTSRGYMDDDPIVYAAHDWVSWLVFASVVGVSGAARLPV